MSLLESIESWQSEMLGDSADLVETEWDAEINRRLSEVRTGKAALVDHEESMRKALDPSFYPDLATFRAAVADGTVDVAKGCRNMAEYHQSLEGAL